MPGVRTGIIAEDLWKMSPGKSGKSLSSHLQSERHGRCSIPGSSSPEETNSVLNNRDPGAAMGQGSPFSSDTRAGTAISTPISPYAMSPWRMSPTAMEDPFLDGKSYGCIASMVRQHGHTHAVAADRELLYTGSDSRNIRVWKIPALEEYGCFKSGSGSVKALLVVGEKIFSAHHDHKIRVWQRSAGSNNYKQLATLPTLKDHVQKCMNPKNYVQVRRHHKCVGIEHVDTISSLAYDVERGLLYSGSWDKTVKVWRTSDFRCVESIEAHEDAVNSVAVGHDGSLFTGSTDGSVKMWTWIPETAKHVLADTLRNGPRSTAVNALAVPDDGNILYAGLSDGTVEYWDGREFCGFLRGHKLAILCLATAKSLVFSGSADKTVGIWRREAGRSHRRLAVLEGHMGPVKCIAASVDIAFDGRCIVYTGSLDHSVKVWWVSMDQNEEDNCTRNPVLSPAWVQRKLRA